MRSFYLFTLAASLAGQALAQQLQLNVTVGHTDFTATDLVDFGDTGNTLVATANCATNCTGPLSTIKACGNNNDQCLCTNDTATNLQSCHQCLFTYLVDENIRAPNPLIGSQPALSAFVSACAAVNITVKPLALTLPPSWEGPESNKLGMAATVVAVAAGTLLGGGGLYILSTIE